MVGADLVGLPVHGGGAGVVDLDAVHAQVPYAALRVVGYHKGQGDVPARVQGPALEDGKPEEVDLVSLQHHLLARTATHDPRLVRRQFLELPQGPQLLAQALRRGLHQAKEALHALGQLVQPLGPQGPGHAALGAEDVDEDGNIVALDVLEEEGRATALDHPVAYLRDLQVPANWGGNPFQLPTVLQQGNEVTQVFVRHGASL